MKKSPFWIVLSALVSCFLGLSILAGSPNKTNVKIRILDLTRRIPERTSDDVTGSQFAQYVAGMDSQDREEAIREEILKGNIPDFLRTLVPVQLHAESPQGEPLVATIFVAPDYLAIGSNSNFLRTPMNLRTAIDIVDRLGFILPTKKMVDAIYLQSQVHLSPQPLPAGPQMRSTEYYRRHNEIIDEQYQSLGVQLGDLVSGDKKDIVITNLLTRNVGKIAIYGWHRGPGKPIQPLSTVHAANYADYSHGVRLVSEVAILNGEMRPVSEILQDPSTARVLSDEGALRNVFSGQEIHLLWQLPLDAQHNQRF